MRTIKATDSQSPFRNVPIELYHSYEDQKVPNRNYGTSANYLSSAGDYKTSLPESAITTHSHLQRAHASLYVKANSNSRAEENFNHFWKQVEDRRREQAEIEFQVQQEERRKQKF